MTVALIWFFMILWATSFRNCKKVGCQVQPTFLFAFIPLPNEPHPHGGGHGQDTCGHQSCQFNGLHALDAEHFHVAAYRVIHGVVKTCAGNQG